MIEAVTQCDGLRSEAALVRMPVAGGLDAGRLLDEHRGTRGGNAGCAV